MKQEQERKRLQLKAEQEEAEKTAKKATERTKKDEKLAQDLLIAEKLSRLHDDPEQLSKIGDNLKQVDHLAQVTRELAGMWPSIHSSRGWEEAQSGGMVGQWCVELGVHMQGGLVA